MEYTGTYEIRGQVHMSPFVQAYRKVRLMIRDHEGLEFRLIDCDGNLPLRRYPGKTGRKNFWFRRQH